MIRRVTFCLSLLLSLCSESAFGQTITQAAKVFDSCVAASSHDKMYCRSLVMSSNFAECYSKCSTSTLCFDECALKDNRAYPPSAAAARKAKAEAAAKKSKQLDEAKDGRAFLGMSEADVTKRLGPPQSTSDNESPDGPFRMLTFAQTANRETYFVLFKEDGDVVRAGQYNGRSRPAFS